jgi:CHASE2 domain-containing sensor protein
MNASRHHNVLVLLVLALVTLVPWLLRLSPYSDQMSWWDRWSYDAGFSVRATTVHPNVLIVQMDERSASLLHQTPEPFWSRTNHVQLLHALTRGGAKTVTFDVLFADRGDAEADAQLAAAIRAHGRVALAGYLGSIGRGEVTGLAPTMPAEPMRSAAAGLGITTPRHDADGTVRQHFEERERLESLPWVAARLAGAAGLVELQRTAPRWMNYYGPTAESLPHLSYVDALDQPVEMFRDKSVFVGGSPAIQPPGRPSDSYRTPYTAWDRHEAAGVDLVATQFLNLLQGDSLTRLPPLPELLLLLIWGGLSAIACLHSRPGVRVAGLAVVVVTVLGLGWGMPRLGHLWFSWVLPLVTQVPVALLCLVLDRRAGLSAGREEGATPVELGGAGLGSGAGAARGEVVEAPAETPLVADHTLLRRVGTGAYGDVWVARNAVGILHAVKVIHRRAFDSAEPFEREFRGITRFMPISRSHPGFVHVLQAGPETVKDYFYYVMELADNAGGAGADPLEHYQPATLASHLRAQKRLSAEDCLQLGLRMTDALNHLHSAQLIHRDIKPSNIIFVGGQPKLADIGLVTRMAEHPRDVSFLGTRGYLAPEGPGTPAADIYSLGKVLYEAYTGLDREQFPSLPTSLLETPSVALAELNQIVLEACEVDPSRRYQSAVEFHRKLARLRDRLAQTERSRGARQP